MGLRERKKAQTRQRIADTAHRLFGERGFQRVTVAEVAREADVAEATLFNYFPTKEDLFYSGLEEFGARLVEAVRQRPAGEPALVAFRTFLLGEAEQLDRIADDRVALEHASANARVVLASPALQTRERQVLAGIATALAAALDGRTRRSGPARRGERPAGSAHRPPRLRPRTPGRPRQPSRRSPLMCAHTPSKRWHCWNTAWATSLRKPPTVKPSGERR